MNKGWLELESDPGLFTLLLQDFGVKGVQVEEIYDLQKPIEGTTYGFIFLFRWIEERRSRRKNTISDDESFVKDDNVVNNIFFAQQMIPNSCASHALLSVLLNCEKVSLGETLLKLKLDCKNMNPENKGYAIGNIPELARAHNSHARQEPSHLPEKQQGMTVRRMEAFHFVSYVPIQGHLFELDGLKPYPIDHGPWDPTEDWTEKFRRVISERLGMATGGEPYHDIRFNLMAVVPDKVSLYEHKLSTLRTNRHIVLEALHQLLGDQEKMVRASNPNITVAEKEKCIAAVKKHGVDTGAMTINDLPLPSIKTEPSSSLSMGKFESQTLQTATSTQKSVAEVKHSEKLEVKEMKVKVEIPMEVDEVAVTTTSSTQPVAVTVASSTGSTQTPSQIQTVSSVVSCAASSMTKSESNLSIPVVTVASSESGASTTLLAGSDGQTDVTQPLTIETKFSVSPGPSSESTDTASEVGSCFSSPSSSTFGNSAQNSPNVSCGEKDSPNSVTDGNTTVKSKTKFSSQQGFRPKDLIALFKNVENEIKVCETKLQDEQEKIKKYKIDDCRRSHNYDQFLCTFLSMLAEQGHLAELVQQHSLVKKRVPGHIGKLSKINQNDKRKRPKPKRRR